MILAAVLAGLVLAGAATASPSTPRVSLVSLSPGKIKVHSRGEFAIGLVCRNATGRCTGVVTVRLKGRPGAAAAPAKVRLQAGRTTPLTLTLSRPARRALASRHQLKVAITVQVRDRRRQEARLTVVRGLVPGAPIGCWPQLNPKRGASRLINSAAGRLFSYLPGSTGTPRIYGCLYEFDHAFPLDDPAASPLHLMVNGVPMFADPFVASLVEGTDTTRDPKFGEPVWYFASWDLRTGRVHLDRLSEPGLDLYHPLVVSPTDGAIAWIYSNGQTDSSATVNADDTGGYRRLDIGAGIDPTSLRLSGNVVSWTHDGLTRTATVS